MEEIKYRHEYKYPLSKGQVLIEDVKLNVIAQKDLYAGNAGFYNIRSLYFDDYYDSCYMDNVNGVDDREKYRIRIYNCSREWISLELKQKLHGKTCKSSCRITQKQCEKLMKGIIPSDIDQSQQVLHKLAYLMAVRLMHPVVIVEYNRVPYVYRQQDANVRITFDSNIISIPDPEAFFDSSATGRGILPEGKALMEVKYDSFLPDEINALLQLNNLQASTFSKYYLCRKFR